MRKVIALLLTFAMALSLVVIAGATETENGSVSLKTEKKVNSDNTVTYTFTLDASNSKGVGALEFYVKPTGLTFKERTFPDGEKLKAVFAAGKEAGEGLNGAADFKGGQNNFIAYGGNAAKNRVLRELVTLVSVTYTINNSSNYSLKVTGFKACLSGEQAALKDTRYDCVAEPIVDGGSAGVTVSGTVTSWNDQNVAVYLYPTTGTDLSIRKALKEGNASGALATATVGTVSGPNSRKYEQTYSISGVEPGEYRLVAHKPGYATYIETVTLNSDEIDKSLTIYRLGDINLDGKVNVKDSNLLFKHVSKRISLDSDVLYIADVNFDGKLNVKDSNRLFKFISNRITDF